VNVSQDSSSAEGGGWRRWVVTEPQTDAAACQARPDTTLRGVVQRRSGRSVPMPRGFNRLLVAWFASVTGDGMRFAALPLLALTLSPSPAAISAVAAATTLPWLLVALPAGALVDRLDPAAVIAWVNAGRAVVTALLVVAVVTHREGIPLLCAVGFLLTTGETFADSAGQSLLVRLVPPDRLESANARFVGSENVGLDLIGPLVAGGLFVVAHWLPFAIAAAIFLTTSSVVLAMRGHRAVDPGNSIGVDAANQMATGRPRRLSMSAGLRVIFTDPQLRALVVTVAIMSAAIAAAEGVLVLYSTTSLRLPTALYPTLLACYSVGLLLAATAVSRWGTGMRPGRVMALAVAVIGATLLAMGVFHHPLVAWCSFLLMGAAGGVWNVLSASRRQRRTPQSMIARVSSTFRAIAWGALPLGTALGGLIGERWSVPTVFVVAGLLVLVLAAVSARFLTAGPDEVLATPHAGEVPATPEPGEVLPVQRAACTEAVPDH
jgi:MFS family permease